jgi:hypothetical protein
LAIALVLLLPDLTLARWPRYSRPGSRAWRVRELRRVVPRPFNKRELGALHRATLVGRGEPGLDGTPARLYNYAFGQVRRKMRILKRGGFSRPERRRLLLGGVCEP